MIDTAMTLLFPFLDFIPFGLPRYWIHRDKLKIRYRYVVMLLTAVSCVNSAAFYLINQGGYEAAARWTTLMRYSFMLFNLICSFLLIREQFQKLMLVISIVIVMTVLYLVKRKRNCGRFVMPSTGAWSVPVSW